MKSQDTAEVAECNHVFTHSKSDLVDYGLVVHVYHCALCGKRKEIAEDV